VGLIYLDACLLIYLTERHTRWGEPVADAMARAEGAGFGISPLVKCECLVGPIRRGDPVRERAYTELFELFVALAMPETMYLQAAELRAASLCGCPTHYIWRALNTIAAPRCGRTTIAWCRHHMA
jgi:hypothetical protein